MQGMILPKKSAVPAYILPPPRSSGQQTVVLSLRSAELTAEAARGSCVSRSETTTLSATKDD
jgi:hypothetical protein